MTTKEEAKKAKTAVKKAEKKAEAVAAKAATAVKKAPAKAAVKKAPAKAAKPAVKKAPAAKKAAKPVEIFVQSPLGGNITPAEIAAKLPEGVESVFVRVDQNKLWWIRGDETGSVDIW